MTNDEAAKLVTDAALGAIQTTVDSTHDLRVKFYGMLMSSMIENKDIRDYVLVHMSHFVQQVTSTDGETLTYAQGLAAVRLAHVAKKDLAADETLDHKTSVELATNLITYLSQPKPEKTDD